MIKAELIKLIASGQTELDLTLVAKQLDFKQTKGHMVLGTCLIWLQVRVATKSSLSQVRRFIMLNTFLKSIEEKAGRMLHKVPVSMVEHSGVSCGSQLLTSLARSLLAWTGSI